MPTIIDELVLRFSLDAKGFDQGQRKVGDQVDKLGDRAKRAGAAVDKAGAGTVAFFRGLEHPVAALRGHLEGLATAAAKPQRQFVELGAQARRTGKNVEAGALEGAASLRALGVAGTAAFGVLAGLNKVMKDAGQNARGIFNASLAAGGAGMPIGQFSAATRALFSRQAVPETDTSAFLQSWEQAKEQYLQNNPGPAIALDQALAVAGINAEVMTNTPQEGLAAAAKRFHGVSEATAIASGQNIGMTPALALGARREGGGLGATIAAERRRITQEQSEAALKLIRAENDLSTSFTTLKNLVFDDLTPTLVIFDGWLKKIIDLLVATPEARKALEGGIATGIAGAIVPGGGLAVQAVKSGWVDRVKKFFGFGSGTGSAGAAGGGNIVGAAGKQWNAWAKFGG